MTFRRIVLLTVLVGCGVAPAWAQPASPFAQRTAGLERREGFVPLYIDAARGRVLFEIARPNEDLLYFVSIGKGLGSVELGVDRGATSLSAVIAFERAGARVHVVSRNLQFRALSGNAALTAGVEQSFAGSILAALPIEAEAQGRLLVDATPLLIRDSTDLEGALRRRNQGSFRLDPARSGPYLAKTKAFPRNTEVEVTLTYASDNPGPLVAGVAPDARALTIRLHHSFVQPPDVGYRPRRADSRIGVSAIGFKDYSAPHETATDVRWIRRWRLEKKDPAAALSEPKTPIVFYLDPGIPEPIRSAMRAGTLWWNQAFEAAGYKNAVEVRDPPPDMDPMDIRYSYILWVNRDERGFSNGGHFADPRTGEILVAKPRMDSHRIRTISNYWDAYQPHTGPVVLDGNDGDLENAACGAFIGPIDDLLTALAEQSPSRRMGADEGSLVTARQALVTAHEVGHTLGFGHNWAASMNDRASVMEYPTPRIRLTATDQIDLNDAYQTALGAYDIVAVRYAYTEVPVERERAALDAIIGEMRSRGLLYVPPTDPRWNRYDDLVNPAMYLRETIRQRQLLLSRYGPDVLEPGDPLGELRDMRLWMVYLHHRWAIDAAMRHIAGMYHEPMVKGEDRRPTEIVQVSLQRDLLSLLLDSVQPAALEIPEGLLVQLAPSPAGRDREEMNGATGYAFDQLGAARTLCAMILEPLLDPERAARLVAFADRQLNALTLGEVLQTIVRQTWDGAADASPAHRTLRRVGQRAAVDAMMLLGADPQTTPEARTIVLDQLVRLRSQLGDRHEAERAAEAHIRQTERDIARYLENPTAYAPKSGAPPQPPGAPLGVR